MHFMCLVASLIISWQNTQCIMVYYTLNPHSDTPKGFDTSLSCSCYVWIVFALLFCSLFDIFRIFLRVSSIVSSVWWQCVCCVMPTVVYTTLMHCQMLLLFLLLRVHEQNNGELAAIISWHYIRHLLHSLTAIFCLSSFCLCRKIMSFVSCGCVLILKSVTCRSLDFWYT